MIRYKLVKAQLTDTVYPQQVEAQSFTHDNMEEELKARFGSIAPAILCETVRIISKQLADGNTVSIDGLGTFSIRLGMTKDNITEYNDVRTQDICINGVRFNACKELRHNLGRVDIHVQKDAAIRRERTQEERWVMLYDHMLRDFNHLGYTTVSTTTYKAITGCTDYTARKDLEEYVEGGKLRRIPARKVKIYTLCQDLLPK